MMGKELTGKGKEKVAVHESDMDGKQEVAQMAPRMVQRIVAVGEEDVVVQEVGESVVAV